MALCALTMLNGLGDEMTAAGGALILLLAMVLAWLSTHVADRGDHILGTILTVGAHASLIGLGGHDGYSSGPASSDAPEQQSPPASQENKPEEGGSEAGEGVGEGTGEGGADVGADRRMDIQSKQQHTCAQHSHDEEEEDDEEVVEEDDDVEEDEEEEEVGEEEEEKTAAKLVSVFPDSTTTTTISVRLKFLNDTEEVAVVAPQETVGLLKSKLFWGREQQVKLIYQGQLLQDPKRTLSSLNITHNSVIHCHICQPPAAAAEPEEEEGGVPPPGGEGVQWGVSGGVRAAGVALSTSSLVVPVFVVVLAVVWYFRINYRQFFTAPATISLVGVTVFFTFLVFGMHGR